MAGGYVANLHGVCRRAEQGLPQYAVKLDRWGFITNSMVVSWIVAIGLIIFARAATRNMKGIPGGAQNLLEWLVEGLYNFLESIIGPHLVKRTFWFLATDFYFHSVGQLAGPYSRGWHDWLGTADCLTVSWSINHCSAARMPI